MSKKKSSAKVETIKKKASTKPEERSSDKTEVPVLDFSKLTPEEKVPYYENIIKSLSAHKESIIANHDLSKDPVVPYYTIKMIEQKLLLTSQYLNKLRDELAPKNQ